ncbi:hypothetical protein L1987_56927 [Smallanthus sonchifolius]|uniref:Uncharacterized protein n=1 Tax=Smallanthus sonchifolius TaxID=185202 RepID=A0ACB9DBM2_9ASTR|nr:hypothetical protein L1987_56927 [Smallanthus sonchifolius]
MEWLSLFSLLTLLPLLAALPNTDPPVQSFLPTPSPPVTTIPAFPEQSDASGCPLDLPADLFRNVKSACTGKHALRRSRCCPVLGAWLYSAYSATALGKTIKQTASYYDLPLLPNDSETCVDNVENRLRSNGIELMRANESCDVVYCECGIRLHQLTCTEAFSVNSAGDLVGNHIVQKLEKDCLGLSGCTKCLKTLRLLNTSKSVERSSKMHNEDCELMGLTWLLAKNRSAYIHTVSGVLRATMMNTESCTEGLPLAVDSSEIDASYSSSSSSSSTVFLHSLLTLCLLAFVFYAPTI